MALKYYAVKNGRVKGIFFAWDDCKAQIEGFKNAQYKSFLSVNQARDYIFDRQDSQEESNQDVPYKPQTAIAYVDGSYKNSTGEFSCGAILFYENTQKLFSKKYSDPEMKDMRNVAGEIMGASSVISYCLEHGIKNLEIHHDYEGIAKWANGEWKTNKTGTRAYALHCEEARKKINISFIKVKSHSGDKYNDTADMLAKKALGIS